MFSWGEQCSRGFRLRDGTYEAQNRKKKGIYHLDLGFDITHLSEGLRLLSFVKSNGNAFIIHKNEDESGKRSRGKQKFVECKDKIRAVSCTDEEVMLLTKKGQLLCVGKGNPRLLRCFSGLQVSQVSCGSKHSIALTKDGQVFTWGQSCRGQLGLGPDVPSATSAVQVKSLSDLPLVQVAAGADHSFSVSLSGALFGWGSNSCGQLGLGDTTDRHSPTVVHYLNSKKSCYVSCGLSHTAVLTKDGAVFTFGSGRHGQLGHNSIRDELRPRLVAELWGTRVTQVACGRQHTLVMTEAQRLFSFGSGDQGQLGRGNSHPAVPLPVRLPPEHCDGVQIAKIFAGANCSFATCCPEDAHTVTDIVPWDRQPSLEDLILKWTSGSEQRKQTKLNDIHKTFSSLSRLNRSFLEHRKDKHFQTTANYCGLDLAAAERSFARLLGNGAVLSRVEVSVLEGLSSLNEAPVGVEGLRVYLLLTELLVVVLKHHQDSELPMIVAGVICRLPPESLKVLRDWHDSLPFGTRKRHIEMWINALSRMLQQHFTFIGPLKASNLVQILEDMYNINTTKTGDEKLPETIFYLRLSDTFLLEDVTLWRSTKATTYRSGKPFVLCDYTFLMDLPSKKKAFDLDCTWTQEENQEHQTYFNWFFGWLTQPQPDYFHLRLKRESLVEDTFQQLAVCSEAELRKPLVVHFDGDSKNSDVYKRDLFHHLFLQIVSVDSELLVLNESQTLVWFPSQQLSKKKKQQFLLLGKLCGLALYNQCIIQLPFPLALFKKLLRLEPCLEDLTELSPSIGQSLQYVLNYEDGVEDLDMYFTIDWNKTEVELDPSNPGKPVTNGNRQEFVDAYVQHVFTTSVQRAFEEFRRGFFQVCEGSTVQLFRPEELRGVMVGSQDYDWSIFKQGTVYENPFYKDHPTILMFWEVFEELDEEQKKDFLWFLTGYRRAPVFGLGQIKMRIREKFFMTADRCTDKHFPESLTCHSILELPLYSSKEIMKVRVTEAVQSEAGFRV